MEIDEPSVLGVISLVNFQVDRAISHCFSYYFGV